jgi:hypothetical protein
MYVTNSLLLHRCNIHQSSGVDNFAVLAIWYEHGAPFFRQQLSAAAMQEQAAQNIRDEQHTKLDEYANRDTAAALAAPHTDQGVWQAELAKRTCAFKSLSADKLAAIGGRGCCGDAVAMTVISQELAMGISCSSWDTNCWIIAVL